jgi:hypothetical protein
MDERVEMHALAKDKDKEKIVCAKDKDKEKIVKEMKNQESIAATF